MDNQTPQLNSGAWVAPRAVLIGAVSLAENASIWYGAVLRADGARITIGNASNVQDGSVLHTDPGFPVTVGMRVSIGHRAILHGCTVEDDVLVGMGAIVMNGAQIGRGSLLAAGTVVLEGMKIPPNSLAVGLPAKVRGSTSTQQRRSIIANAARYVQLKEKHSKAQRRT